MAEEGRRVLGLAYKFLGRETIRDLPREKVESDLTFAGFCAFECKTRGDSPAIMSALSFSDHKLLMLTGTPHTPECVFLLREKRVRLVKIVFISCCWNQTNDGKFLSPITARFLLV